MFITHPLSIQEVNSLLSEHFIRIFGNIVEHCPAAAIGILKKRPFKDTNCIIESINELLDNFRIQEIEEILQLHPDSIENLTVNNYVNLSQGINQNEAHQVCIDDVMRLLELNNKYKEKFGFPIILSSKTNDVIDLFSELMSRLQNTKQDEIQIAVREVKKVVSVRIHELVQ